MVDNRGRGSAVRNAEAMTYCFDIDGVLCTNTWGEYEKAEPIPKVIAEVNRLHREGHKIILHTARGAETGIDWRATTERQLAGWGVGYDELWMGKPNADVYVDDRGVNVADWIDGIETASTKAAV